MTVRPLSDDLDAVAAVQLENRKLKGELALLGRNKEKMEKEFRESGPRKETDGKLAEAINEHRSGKKKDKEKEQGKESEFDAKNKRKLDGKAINSVQKDKLFISPPTSPVSFVSRAICQIEGKSPIDIR